MRIEARSFVISTGEIQDDWETVDDFFPEVQQSVENLIKVFGGNIAVLTPNSKVRFEYRVAKERRSGTDRRKS